MDKSNKQLNKVIYPQIINIELTNACNLECVFCDHSSLKKKIIISETEDSLLEKMFADIAGIKVYELGLVGLGEPLLDRRLEPHLEIIGRYKNVFDRISINTNAVALTEDKAALICRSCINFVTFSLNATDAQTYLKLMQHDFFDKVVQNIHNFMMVRKKLKRFDIKVNIQLIDIKENNRLKIEKIFRDEWETDLHIFTRELYNKPVFKERQLDDLGTFDISAKGRYPCWSIFSRVYIDVEGNFYPCTIGNDCYRKESDLCLGNVTTENIIDLFNCKRFIAAREKTYNSEPPFKECVDCNVWMLLPNNFKWDEQTRTWKQRSDVVRLSTLDAPLD